MNSFKKIIFPLAVCLILSACHDEEEEKLARIEAKAAKTKVVIANQCRTDDDCMVTGCHGTMCRAMPEPDYCDHRIVISMENGDDIGTVKRIVSEQLTVGEADTIRIGGYAANKWTLSFHATQAQRERVETALDAMNQSGFARLHPNAGEHTETAFKTLSKTDPDLKLKSMKGAGKLIEKQIRSGDVLSKDDIRNAWEQVSEIQNIHISDDDDIERIWAYDVIFDNIAYLRLWPIDKRQRLSVRLWKSMTHRVDNGDLIITADISKPLIETFKSWTADGSLIALMLGNEIIASALPQKQISDGRFELIIKDGAKSETLISAVETLERIANIRGSVHIDEKATESVERDIYCHEKYPRKCGCIDGYCGWHLNSDYNACLYEL